MDIQKTAKEIGVFETAINLSKVRNSEDVIRLVGAAMPLPDEDMELKVGKIAKWLHGFGKRKYMFFVPEIALIDELIKMAGPMTEIIIVIPQNLEYDAKERIKNNLPVRVKTMLLEEPYFMGDFFPENGLMVISGYTGGNRLMTLSDTYRLVEHYCGFRGKKVFVPYVKLEHAARFEGWMELKQQRITTQWGEEL